MSYSGDAAEQVVRMSLETGEVAVRLAGSGAKQLAILLYAILREQKKTAGITVQDFDFELNDYVERIYTPEPVLEYKDYHLLTDGILCVMYSRSSADDDFVVASMGVNPYFEVESNYSRGTVRQEVAPIDFPN